jgi:hypothetical protein
MLKINPNNVEELIFFDMALKKKLPDLLHEFQQWHLAYQVPSLRSLGRTAMLDALNKLGKYVDVLETHFGCLVTVETLDYHIITNFKTPINCAEDELCKYEGYSNFAIAREGDTLYLSLYH